MQCPFCGGSGKCYQQTITYEEVETNRTKKHLTKCFKCNGTGEIKQTNEEWFCGLSTEEKAETLSNVIRKAWIGYVSKECNVDSWEFWEKWLKEVHTDDN